MAEFKLGRLKFWWKGEWQTGQAYVKDDVVRFGGKSYVCTGAHTSGTDNDSFYTALETAPFKWELMTDGVQWAGAWTTGSYYKVGDVVKYGSDTYICTMGHTANEFFADQEADGWDNFVNGVGLEGAWDSEYQYQAGDIVRLGGNSYLAQRDNINANPVTATDDWGIFVHGLNYLGSWSGSTTYYPGDVVKVASSSYVAKQTNTNHNPSADLTQTYWDTLVQGADSSVLTTAGDMAYYQSTGAVRLPKGVDNSVLQIDPVTHLPKWESNVIIPGNLTVDGDAHIVNGDVYQLQLASKSIFGKGDLEHMPFDQFAKYVGSQGYNLNTLVTEMRFDEDSDTAKLFFRPVRFLQKDEWQAAVQLGNTPAAKSAVQMTVYQTDNTPKLSAPKAEKPAVAEAVEEPKKREEKKAQPSEKKDLKAIMGDWSTDDE